jgi:hypothetical protein
LRTAEQQLPHEFLHLLELLGVDNRGRSLLHLFRKCLA